MIETRIQSLWKSEPDRQRARELLATYGVESSQPEIERVRLAALKLCDGDLGKLREVMQAAFVDYRDVLLWDSRK